MQQLMSQSDSLYFTPSGTPMRELDGGPVFPSTNSTKSTPYNDIDAYSAVYSSSTSSGNQNKHKRVRSFSHFLPGSWFQPHGANNREVIVEAKIEKNGACGNDDYFDIDLKPEEQEQLLTSYQEPSGELRLELTESSNSSEGSTSVQSSSEKKSNSFESSEKTLMTNLSSGNATIKSEFDVSAQVLPQENNGEVNGANSSRRKSL